MAQATPTPRKRSTGKRLAPEEAENQLAEAENFREEARGAKAAADMQELFLEREREQRAIELAADELHHVYVFDQEVDERSVKNCIQQLTTWSRQDPGCDVEIQINSPGGAIFDGFALIDFLRDFREKGHKVTIIALGMAASMAGVILQAASEGERVMGENCLLLIHEGSMGVVGDFGEVQDRVKMMGILHERILSLFEARARKQNKKTTKAFIRSRWKRKDWWLTADDARKFGFVDRVR